MLCGKGRVRTQDLGYQAERYDHCATRPVDEFITEEFENDIRSSCQTLGPLYAVESLQEIKVTLQNKLML